MARPEADGFLSTLPARGATSTLKSVQKNPTRFLSTLPARGATYDVPGIADAFNGISIHAPREGSDGKTTEMKELWNEFLSTLPARGATVVLVARL